MRLSDLLPADLVILSADIPDSLSIQSLTFKELPSKWNDFPAPPVLQTIGVDWVRDNKAVGLRVPSAVVVQEYNVLLNPAHQDFSHIHWEEVGPFQWDLRLGRRVKT